LENVTFPGRLESVKKKGDEFTHFLGRGRKDFRTKISPQEYVGTGQSKGGVFAGSRKKEREGYWVTVVTTDSLSKEKCRSGGD